jgi:hypothetical protein
VQDGRQCFDAVRQALTGANHERETGQVAGQATQRPVGAPASEIVDLLAAWTGANPEHIRRHERLGADHRGVLDRHPIYRIVRRVGRAAGHPRFDEIVAEPLSDTELGEIGHRVLKALDAPAPPWIAELETCAPIGGCSFI